ncbi:hypothetical protein ACN47E_000087 [Coniothyrium glycines]
MSTRPTVLTYQLWPAYCFEDAPTYNTWVRLVAVDVHRLRKEPEYPGKDLYFYLNYPIRFVCVVGVIVAIDDINTKYTTLTIDDGSGATLDLKIERILPAQQNVDISSNTTISNLSIISRPGLFEVLVDNHVLDIGTVIKAKGLVTEFRQVKQLDMKRVWLITTTDEEVREWAGIADYKEKVLSIPWHLTAKELRRCSNKMKSRKKAEREQDERKAEHEARQLERHRARNEHLAKRESRLEIRRRKEELMMNAGALK